MFKVTFNGHVFYFSDRQKFEKAANCHMHGELNLVENMKRYADVVLAITDEGEKIVKSRIGSFEQFFDDHFRINQ